LNTANGSGLAVFNLIRGNRHDAAAVLYASDLLELDGEGLAVHANREAQAHPGEAHEGIAFKEHYTGDGGHLQARLRSAIIPCGSSNIAPTSKEYGSW
jgi:hypothetical protein